MLTCHARHGVCAKCYGSNLASRTEIGTGEAVGIIAAQSIGEPGTQLTMRTFHTGGVAGSDITQGLPRVEELFEARKPKRAATLTENAGIVSIDDSRKGSTRPITVTNPETGESKIYQVPLGQPLRVSNGDEVAMGTALTEGALNPHDVLRTRDVEAVQAYLIQEVQRVYRQQGVDINDRHIEVIVPPDDAQSPGGGAGDTDLLPGSMVDVFEFEDANEAGAKKAAEEGREFEPATYTPVLLGITKASLATDSFLSAASFQETTRVLTEAAIKGKIDPLMGLKENVIIGKLVPAGSGMDLYNKANYEEVVEMVD